MRAVFSCALAIVVFCLSMTQVHSQSSLSGGESPSAKNGGPDRSVPGGGAMADFSTLMMLIEQTIEPDGWLANGGTSTMLPYPAGVYVDPKGQLKRVAGNFVGDRTLEDRLRKAASETLKGNKAWQSSSELRMVSLKRLEQALVEASKGGVPLGADIIRLAGINQISYVLVDPSQEDVILAGTADPNRMGYFLEDLAVVCALVNSQTTPLGCSIEPKQERLLATTDFLSKPEAGNMLSKSPKRFADQLSELIGDYDVQVFGMNPRCSTSVALVAADEHMKQMGFGKAKLPVSVKTYFDHMESKNQVSSESLIRWWFAFTDQPITTNPEKSLFRLPSQCVCVLSEQQFVTQTGRQPTGGKDAAADAFAAEMSAKMNELRNFEPNYSRLCCVFETALALQLALDSSSMADFRPWFPNLCGLGKMDQKKVVEPKSVPGLVTTHTLKKKKTNVAVISGGVTISPKQIAEKSNWQATPLLSGTAVPNKSKMPVSNAW
jgi:Protein of unknown function (DUF1598)